MVFHFIIISDEQDNFKREIAIDSQATFAIFHAAIQDAVEYDKSQMASFFEINENFERLAEITLIDMGEGSGTSPLLMDETKLSDIFTDEGQKMIYEFDFFAGRGFYIQLQTIINNKNIDTPVLLKAEGDAPEQVILSDAGLDELPEMMDLMDDDLSQDDFDEFDDIRFEDMDIDELEEYI